MQLRAWMAAPGLAAEELQLRALMQLRTRTYRSPEAVVTTDGQSKPRGSKSK